MFTKNTVIPALVLCVGAITSFTAEASREPQLSKALKQPVVELSAAIPPRQSQPDLRTAGFYSGTTWPTCTWGSYYTFGCPWTVFTKPRA
jgi:hypothetical protein